MRDIKIFLALIICILPIKIAYASEVNTIPKNEKPYIFMEWAQDGNKLSFDILAGIGDKGKYLFLNMNNSVVASSTFASSSIFVQTSKISVKTPIDGNYDFTAELCNDIKRTSCIKSVPLSLNVKKDKIINEIEIENSDMSEERIDELNKNISLKNKDYFDEMMLQNTDNFISRNNKKEKPQNVITARKVLQSGALSTIIYDIKGFNIEDFELMLEKYPRFCAEEGSSGSLLKACSKELSAYLTYLLYFSNDNPKDENIDIQNKAKLNNLTGDISRYPIKDDSSVTYIMTSLMDWYMKPRSPDPSPHNVLLGLQLFNDIDRKNNITSGFGTTINIASHGKYCSNKNNESKRISDIYLKLLSKTGYTDNDNISCLGQKQFQIGSSSYFPQYIRYDETTKSCVVEVSQTKNSLYDKETLVLCKNVNNLKEKGIAFLVDTKNRVSNTTPISELKGDIDKRVLFGKTISATYPTSRVNFSQSQPSNIPFNKTNEIVFEGARISSKGEISFTDDYIMKDMIFAGDCLYYNCSRGLLNQMKIAKDKFKNQEIVLQIQIDKESKIDTTEKKIAFAKSLERFLQKNSYIGGIQFNITSADNSKTGSDIKSLIGYVRSELLASKDSKINVTKIKLALPAKREIADNIPLDTIISFIDSIYLIAYDNYNSTNNRTEHNAQIISLGNDGDMISLANGLLGLKNKGVKANKIVIGVPFFGRIWNNVVEKEGDKLPGLYAKHATNKTDTKLDYKTLIDYYIGKGGYQYYEDNLRGASYIYDGENFISYDTPEIIKQKMDYIYKDGYKGILIGDIVADNGSLTEKVLQSISKGEQKLACNITRVIKKEVKDGDRNADVFALQSYLKCLGYFPDHIDVNGYFGIATKNAVKEFQKDNEITPNGIVDEKTRLLVQSKA